MINVPAAASYLYGRTTYVAAELYTITATVGTIMLTTWPTSILGASPAVLRRGTFRATMSSEVGTVDLTISEGLLTFGGLGLCRSAVRGDFDAATFIVERILDPGGSNIRVPRFRGYVQQVEPGSSELRLVAKDFRSDIDKPVPARTIQPNCTYKYGSAPCGASGGTCGKRAVDCTGHANLIHFGGFPKVLPNVPGKG
jgi:hypothetical protein